MLVRIITALILAPVVVFLTLYLATPWFALILMLIIVVGLDEWRKLCTSSYYLLFVVGLLMAGVAWYVVLSPAYLQIICIALAAFWLLQIIDLCKNKITNTKPGSWDFFFGGTALLGVWSALVLIHQQSDVGPKLTMLILLIVWAADSTAYFSGKFFGLHKLAPEISPNKTIEGVIGGVLGACIVTVCYVHWVFHLPWSDISLLAWLFIAIFTSLISVAGDLFQSRLKRIAGVKDSGSLLPGHGGVLDRIDGLIAAAPVFVAIWWLVF